MKAAHPHLKASGDGSIVNLVTSAMVRWDPTTYGAYAAAKQAVRSLTRTAAVEWAPDGIRVNAIAPHALSPGLQRWTETNPEEAAEFVASIPMRRIGDCEDDIGRAVVALVGPDLRYLTGATPRSTAARRSSADGGSPGHPELGLGPSARPTAAIAASRGSEALRLSRACHRAGN